MYLNLRYVVVIIGTVSALILCGVAFMKIALRSHALPLCWYCGGREVRHSARRSGLDRLARAIRVAPYRCRGCQQRFYAFRTHRALPLPHS